MKAGKRDKERKRDKIWEDCSGFLPPDFEEVLRLMRGDSRERFRRLGIIP